MNNFTYQIHTFGCKVNQYDSSELKKGLENLGGNARDKKPDLIIINTCAVTNTAIKKGKNKIIKLRQDNPRAKIIAMGCFLEINSKDKLPVDLEWGVGRIDDLMERINKITGHKQSGRTDRQLVKSERSRYTIKIQDGCEQFCTYCIVPYTRGKLKSRQAEEILKEITLAIESGFKEIVLSGVHLGLYGVDIKGVDLTGLIKQIIKLPGLGRLRLSSIEVNEVKDELIELIKNNKKLCPHLAIPLQSGSDKILRLMKRPYDTKIFKDKINKIRRAIPEISISTDVIVGFPGEGEKEFNETCKLIKKLRFSRLHVFPYSRHDLSPASKMEGHLSREVKLKRAKKLRSVGEDLSREYQANFSGKELEVVLEKTNKDKYYGTCEYYFMVEFEKKDSRGENAKIGDLLKVKYSK